MEYRCETTSPIGFVQQLVSRYLPHGYWFYVPGCIPKYKDPRSVDEKLLAKYGINVSRSSRTRRQQAGIANIHYLRCRRFFLLLATDGYHPFHDDEGENVRDVRQEPITFDVYSISAKKDECPRKAAIRVQIAPDMYRELTAYFLDMALLRSVEQLGRDLANLPYEPYAPVRQQLLNILRLVNNARKTAGLEQISPTVLRRRHRIVRPFEPSRPRTKTEKEENPEQVLRPLLDGLPQVRLNQGIVR